MDLVGKCRLYPVGSGKPLKYRGLDNALARSTFLNSYSAMASLTLEARAWVLNTLKDTGIAETQPRS